MTPPTLKSLPASSVNQLSHLLQLHPNETSLKYSDRVSRTLPHLPSSLKHKDRFSLSNILSSNPLPANPTEAHLCLLHKPLAASLLHELFTLVSLEVGAHCNSLIAYNTWLSPRQHTAIQRLRELHNLWLGPETYHATFMCHPNSRWGFQESGCEGCILTRTGSDVEVVAALRILLLSRKRTVKPKKGHPRLLGFVEGWLVGLLGEGKGGREALSGGQMEGEELKIVRKRIWKERKEKKRRAKGKGKETKDERHDEERYEEEMSQEACDFDAEHAIIDHYTKLRETLVFPSLQPAPRQTPSLTTGSSAKTLSSYIEIEDVTRPQQFDRLPVSSVEEVTLPKQFDRLLASWVEDVARPKQFDPPPASSVYTAYQSYEKSTYQPPRRAPAWQKDQTSAGKQAEQYRALLTPLAEEAEPVPRSKLTNKKQQKYFSQIKPARESAEPAKTAPKQKVKATEKGKWDTRENRTLMKLPPAPALPPSPPAQQEEKKRETRWSNFSRRQVDDRRVMTDDEGEPTRNRSRFARRQEEIEAEAEGRVGFVKHIKRMQMLLCTHLDRWRNPSGGVRETHWPTLSYGEFQFQAPITGVE